MLLINISVKYSLTSLAVAYLHDEPPDESQKKKMMRLSALFLDIFFLL